MLNPFQQYDEAQNAKHEALCKLVRFVIVKVSPYRFVVIDKPNGWVACNHVSDKRVVFQTASIAFGPAKHAACLEFISEHSQPVPDEFK